MNIHLQNFSILGMNVLMRVQVHVWVDLDGGERKDLCITQRLNFTAVLRIKSQNPANVQSSQDLCPVYSKLS